MKIKLLAASAFAAALALPLGASAQQYQAPRSYAGSHGNPSPARMQRHWARRLGGLNLSGDQQQRIQSMINQYAQSHPQGSPRDPGAERAFRHQLMGVLSPDQQNAYRQQMRARRAQMRQRQMQGGYQQGGYQQGGYSQGNYGDQRYQGYPGQGYQGQGYQGQGYPDQRYQQGPPQQYQQGPPQQYQQGPPQGYSQDEEPSGPPA